MELYTFLRQFADSWMLLALFAFFIGMIIWVFRPGSTKTYSETANIPFRNEDAPADIDGQSQSAEAKEARA